MIQEQCPNHLGALRRSAAEYVGSDTQVKEVMGPIELEIESAFEARGRAYVVARLLDHTDGVNVPSGAMLGGCRVEQWLEMPRAIDADGNQRTDLLGFCLATPTDLGRLKVGDRVVLV